ncbi:MAG: hypothetical protein ACRDTX_02615 [Pseudonocardiaceae bacterium]
MTNATFIGEGHVIVPLSVASGARLSFDNGVERLEVRADKRLKALLSAQFADPHPVVWAAEHNVHVEYPLGARLLRRMQPSAVSLNPIVAWSLDVHGGAAHLDADLRGVTVQAVSFHSGIARSRLVLGNPGGERTIRLSSVKELRIDRPAGVPVRIEIAKGATNVTLDDRFFGAVGNGLADQAAGYAATADRYRLIISGGVDGLTISHTMRSIS